MKQIKDTATVRQMMNDKQALEVRLAWDLLEVFNDAEMGFIGKLRDMVRASIPAMHKFYDEFRLPFQNKWNGSWRNYAVCTDNGIIDWHPATIEFKSKQFTAQHCADWIRIFGEVIEDVAKGKYDAARKGFQRGGLYHWTKFDPKDPSDQSGAGRRRVTGEFLETEKYFEQRSMNLGHRAGPIMAVAADVPDPARLTQAVPVHLSPVWGFMHDISPSAGINRWRILENDTLGKMDQVFGLMPGATISGTTTDNIYFFDQFGGLGLDPMFFLLPTATIVAPGHHSLLEVALPLSLNSLDKHKTEPKINNYKVGLYRTLLPTSSQAKDRPRGVGEIESILGIAEDHPTNKLMLIYYEGTTPAGCLLFDQRTEKEIWSRIKTGEKLMQIFRPLPAWPKEEQVRRLMGELGLV
jgi:hypothetical protein